MKVENVAFYVGKQPQNGVSGEEKGQEQRKNLFAGDLTQENTLQDRIAQKKAQAQKQAMKVVSDAFAGDRTIDEDMEARRERVKELKEEKVQLSQEAAGVAERREALEKAYAAGEVSEEEYASETENLSQEEQTYQQKISEKESAVIEENAVVRGTRLERLKHNPMGEAREQADAILEAAGEEIIGMVMEDAKEKLDEEDEQRQEQADEIREQREEQEAFIEKQQENRSEAEELLEEMPADEMLSMNRTQSDVKQEIQNMLDKMKLLSEDIKGVSVDETL